MSVDAKAEIVIERPRSEIAKIMFDPKCDPLWIGGLKNVFPLTPGSLRKDSRVDRVGNYLGREYAAKLLVVKDVPERSLEISADEPFEMTIKYDLDDVDGGTRVKLSIQGIVDHQYQVPPAVFGKMVTEAITNDLRKLKKHAEMQ